MHLPIFTDTQKSEALYTLGLGAPEVRISLSHMLCSKQNFYFDLQLNLNSFSFEHLLYGISLHTYLRIGALRCICLVRYIQCSIMSVHMKFYDIWKVCKRCAFANIASLTVNFKCMPSADVNLNKQRTYFVNLSFSPFPLKFKDLVYECTNFPQGCTYFLLHAHICI